MPRPGRTRQSLENHARIEQRRHESMCPRHARPRRGLVSSRHIRRGCRRQRRPAPPCGARQPNRTACPIPTTHPPCRHPIAEHRPWTHARTRLFADKDDRNVRAGDVYRSHTSSCTCRFGSTGALRECGEVRRTRSSAVPWPIPFSLSRVAIELGFGRRACRRRDPLNDCPNTP